MPSEPEEDREVGSENEQNKKITVYEYGLLVIIRLEPENRLLSSGNRIFGYQIPELYFGSAFLKPEFLITRKNRPELSGKTECPALPISTKLQRPDGCD